MLFSFVLLNEETTIVKKLLNDYSYYYSVWKVLKDLFSEKIIMFVLAAIKFFAKALHKYSSC